MCNRLRIDMQGLAERNRKMKVVLLKTTRANYLIVEGVWLSYTIAL
jgi:hypothetical protein